MKLLIIKPTKHNKKALIARGLFSNDTSLFFNLYETILSDKTFKKKFYHDEINLVIYDWFTLELNHLNVKY